MKENFKQQDSILLLNISLAAEQRIQASADYKDFSESLIAVAHNFKIATDARSIPDMIENELLVLNFTLEKEANSRQAVQSLNAALMQLKSCAKSFNHLANKPEMYKETSPEIFSQKDMKDGLPLDGARKFFNSHRTRLNNEMKSSVDRLKKDLFTQRIARLKVLSECYIELQTKILGVTKPPKNKGISR